MNTHYSFAGKLPRDLALTNKMQFACGVVISKNLFDYISLFAGKNKVKTNIISGQNIDSEQPVRHHLNFMPKQYTAQ